MTWAAPKTWVYAEIVSSAMLNTEVRDRLVDLWKYTAKGDMLMSTSATVLGRLPIAANGRVLSSDGTTFAWQPPVPIGTIILWSGSVVSIPSGWALCNGTLGTPNLSDYFVAGIGSFFYAYEYGYGSPITSTHHSHSVSGNVAAYWGTDLTGPGGAKNTALRNHSHSASVAGNYLFTMPPYYALCYIMRYL